MVAGLAVVAEGGTGLAGLQGSHKEEMGQGENLGEEDTSLVEHRKALEGSRRGLEDLRDPIQSEVVDRTEDIEGVVRKVGHLEDLVVVVAEDQLVDVEVELRG